jgi:hypothetical protein
MKISKFSFALAIILTITFYSSCMLNNKDSVISVTVQINYGTQKAMRDTVIKVNAGITALEALQYVSNVETHPKGKYVFVKSVDDVEGERGVMAWYYELNHKSTKRLAINQPLQNGDVLTWIYKTDVCSCKVDN